MSTEFSTSIMFEELTETIERLRTSSPHVVVAVSGFGGLVRLSWLIGYVTTFGLKMVKSFGWTISLQRSRGVQASLMITTGL